MTTAARLSGLCAVLLGAVLLVVGAPGAGAVTTVAETLAAAQGGVVVAAGSGADAARLRQLVEDNGGADSLLIAVYDGGVLSAETRARQLRLDGRLAMVIVFTPTEIGVSSATLDDAAVRDALDRAGDAVTDPDEVVAASAILRELAEGPDPPPSVWPWLLGAALLAGAVMLGRRMLRERAEEAARSDAMTDARARMRARLQAVADQILQLQDHVAIADDRPVADAFAAASGRYAEVQQALALASTPGALQALERRVAQVEAEFRAIADRVG